MEINEKDFEFLNKEIQKINQLGDNLIITFADETKLNLIGGFITNSQIIQPKCSICDLFSSADNQIVSFSHPKDKFICQRCVEFALTVFLENEVEINLNIEEASKELLESFFQKKDL